MSGVIGEYWDFTFYEKQKKKRELVKKYEDEREKKLGEGTKIDDYEAKKE